MKLQFYILLPLFLLSFGAQAENVISVRKYIKTYQDVAIAEMNRTGIPASIKVGQAILESSHGNSKLARNSFNHFGIKCKKEWRGKKYMHKDDDRNKKGKLIKSCFRVYDSVLDSYIDHSNFLMSRERYSSLFKISATDYKGWAHGLKKCGYATAKQYAQKLIRIIETHELYILDFQVDPNVLLASSEKNKPTFYSNTKRKIGTRVIKNNKRLDLKGASFLNSKPIFPIFESTYEIENVTDKIYGKALFPKQRKSIFLVNGLAAVTLGDGQSLEDISSQYDLSIEKLVKFNDIAPNQKLMRGQYIFLQSKSPAHSKIAFHQLKNGENLYYIAQLYGIKLNSLLKRNRLMRFEKLPAGTMIKLKGKKIEKITKQSYRIKKVK